MEEIDMRKIDKDNKKRIGGRTMINGKELRKYAIHFVLWVAALGFAFGIPDVNEGNYFADEMHASRSYELGKAYFENYLSLRDSMIQKQTGRGNGIVTSTSDGLYTAQAHFLNPSTIEVVLINKSNGSEQAHTFSATSG